MIHFVYTFCLAMPNGPYKPEHLKKTKMIPIRMTQDEFELLSKASQRFGRPISVLLREGARMYVAELEQKDEPAKGKETN